MAKLFTSEAAVHATSETIKIFGSYGCSTEYPAERLLCDVHSLSVVEGTSSPQKTNTAGTSMGNVTRPGWFYLKHSPCFLLFARGRLSMIITLNNDKTYE